jgi:hypothetical protein
LQYEKFSVLETWKVDVKIGGGENVAYVVCDMIMPGIITMIAGEKF